MGNFTEKDLYNAAMAALKITYRTKRLDIVEDWARQAVEKFLEGNYEDYTKFGWKPIKQKSMKKQAKLSLETAKELYAQGGASRQFALDNYSEEELTDKGWPKSWGDLENIEGWIKYGFGGPEKTSFDIEDYRSKYAFPTIGDLESSLAFRKLRFLADKMNDGWEPNIQGVRWYIDVNEYNGLIPTSTITKSALITFKSYEMAAFSLEHHKDLWKQYYQIK